MFGAHGEEGSRVTGLLAPGSAIRSKLVLTEGVLILMKYLPALKIGCSS